MNDEILIDLNDVFPKPVEVIEPVVEVMEKTSFLSDDELLDSITKYVEELKRRILERQCPMCKDYRTVQYTADTWLKETVTRMCPECRGQSGELRRKYYELTRFK